MATADFPVQLAQIIASARQSQQPFNIGQAQPARIGELQNMSGGGGAIGEQFGKGAGDYLQQTLVEAQKKKYMEENDPQIMNERTLKFVEAYQKMTPAERENIKKASHINPQAYSMLVRMSKARPELFDVVKNPEPGKPDEVYPRSFTMPEAQQKAEALGGMLPADRNKTMFAQENLQGAQAAAVPIQAAAQTAQAAAATKQASLEEARNPSTIAMQKAHAWYYYNGMKNARDAQTLEDLKAANKQIQTILATTETNYFKLKSNPQTSAAADELLIRNALEAGGKIKQIDPDDPVGPALYKQAVDHLVQKTQTALVAAQKYNKLSPFWGRVGASKPQPLDPKWGQAATMVIDRWEKDISSVAELKLFTDSYVNLARHYWEDFYPDAKTPEEATKIIQKEILNLKERVAPQVARAEQVRKLSKRSSVPLPGVPTIGAQKPFDAILTPQQDAEIQRIIQSAGGIR
jgi:hypothetical protein